MNVNLFFNWLWIGELLKFKIGPPCDIHEQTLIFSCLEYIGNNLSWIFDFGSRVIFSSFLTCLLIPVSVFVFIKADITAPHDGKIDDCIPVKFQEGSRCSFVVAGFCSGPWIMAWRFVKKKPPPHIDTVLFF